MKCRIRRKSVYNKSKKIIESFLNKYEFDEKGNWVKREMYRENDNIPSSVVLRTFEYFK